MRILKTTILLAFAGLFACTTPNSQLPEDSVIVLKESKDILPISSFANSVDYLELKVAGTGVEIGEIEAVNIFGDDLIVKHRMSGKSSFIRFNKKGDFVIEIVGKNTPQIRDPKDVYVYPNGFAVLAENGIHMVSKDGKYIRQLVRGTMPGDNFFYSDETFNVINEKSAGEILATYSPESRTAPKSNNFPDPVLRNRYSSVERIGKEQIHFYSVLNDSVLSFSNGETHPVYILKGDEMPTFAELITQLPDKEDKEILKFLRENEHVIVRKYFETKDYLYLTYWVGSDPTSAILNKKNGNLRYFGFGVNDIDGGVWDQAFCLSDKNELYIPITAYKVGGHKISNKKVKGFDRLQKQVATSGNPVIMRCKLK